MPTSTVSVNALSATTALDHAARYPSDVVVGFLLGAKTDENWKVTEAIPVAHHEFVGTASAAALLMVG